MFYLICKIALNVSLSMLFRHDHSAGTQDLSERLNLSFTLSTSFLATSILPVLPICTSMCYFTTLASQSNKAIDFPTLRVDDSGKKALTSPLSSPMVHLNISLFP